MISMYAIPNCDTVKKARAFLDTHHITYTFVDFKKSPPTKAHIQAWSEYLGELPVNKKGMTYRKYKDQYEALECAQKIEFIIANTSLIKRPVLEQDGKPIAVGFDEAQYAALVNQ